MMSVNVYGDVLCVAHRKKSDATHQRLALPLQYSLTRVLGWLIFSHDLFLLSAIN